MPPAARREEDSWAGELADVRERLARLETRAENHERASAERHGLALAAGAGGAAGGLELVKSLIGG